MSVCLTSNRHTWIFFLASPPDCSLWLCSGLFIGLHLQTSSSAHPALEKSTDWPSPQYIPAVYSPRLSNHVSPDCCCNHCGGERSTSLLSARPDCLTAFKINSTASCSASLLMILHWAFSLFKCLAVALIPLKRLKVNIFKVGCLAFLYYDFIMCQHKLVEELPEKT